MCALLGGAVGAAEPDLPVVVFVANTDDPRADAMWLALEAHLNGIPVSVRRMAPEPGVDLAGTARDELAEGRAAAAIWIAENPDAFFYAAAPFSDPPAAEPIPETGEGWPSRCALVGSLIVPRAEALSTAQPTTAVPAAAAAPPQADDQAKKTEPPPEPAPKARRGVGLSLSLRAGLAVPTSRLDPFVIAGVNVDVALPPLDRQFSLALDATYTSPHHEGTVRDRTAPYREIEFDIRAFEIKWALDVMWRFYDTGKRFAAFVGGGPIAQLVIARERTSFDTGDNSVRTLAAGGEIALVLELRIGLGGIVLDARYAYTPLDADLVGETNAGNATAALGYRFEL